MLGKVAVPFLTLLFLCAPATAYQSLDVPESPTFSDNLPAKKQKRQAGELTFETKGTIEREKSDLVICSEGAATGENPEGTLKSCDAAVEAAPRNGDAYYYRGFVNYHRESYEEAAGDFTRAIDLGSSRLAESYYQRGVCKEQQRRLREAALDFRKAAEIKPDWSAARRKVEEYQWADE